MAKTNSGLVAYCQDQVGLPYWYGTFGQKGSKALYEAKKKQYPKYYTAKDYPSQYGKRVHDCAGLIKGYLWSSSPTSTPKYDAKTDYGAKGFYSHATKKGEIKTFDKVNGRLVFKGSSPSSISHVGVYVDGYVIEAKGHAYGVIKSKFSSSWTYWAQCNLIEEDAKPQPTPTPTPAPTPAPEPKPNKLQPAKSFNTAYNGTWKVTASALNMRYGAGTEWGIIATIKNGSKVRCYGYYTRNDGTDWLCVVYGNTTGYCCKTYLKKV
jgi:cell wall-associated NlpC family hydrolase